MGVGAGGAAMLLAAMTEVGMAYEAAYPRTTAGVIEVKTLPAATVMAAAMQEGNRNAAFRELFRYIQDRKVPMTVPVEVDPGTNAAMRFYLNSALTNNPPASSETVSVGAQAGRTVLSIGLRGSYRQKNFSKAVTRLATWLTEHPEWAVDGNAYQVFWNSPFVPFFLKTSEVHLPVRRVEHDTAKSGAP